LCSRPDACRSSAAFRSAAAIPYVGDAPDAIRGLGLQFRLRDGEEWRTAMINRPVFMFNTARAFYDNLIASQPDPNTHSRPAIPNL
jgi:catalase